MFQSTAQDDLAPLGMSRDEAQSEAGEHPSRATSSFPQQAVPPGTTTELLREAQRYADEIVGRPNHGDLSAPLEDLRRLAELGVLTAALPARLGGLGLGTESGQHLALLRLLAAIGGGDLVLGRLVEGHINALLLVVSFGTEAQKQRAAADAKEGLLFGVWNTGAQDLLRLAALPDGRFQFTGVKTFATGAAFVQRPVVTAQLGPSWQMTIPRMDDPAVRAALAIDRSFWQPLGMESSESYRVDFTGVVIDAEDLIGDGEDFYEDPLFRGGAIRFAAVHAGAVLRLYHLFTAWLANEGRGEDPYQIARLGEVALGAQEAVLWIERAAAVAENGLASGTEKLASERMVECAGMTRVAVERLATAMMQRVIAGVGARGLLRPHPFERILRNLTMYLRQPSPDQTLAEIGRASVRAAALRAGGPAGELWSTAPGSGSMPSSYFDRLYEQTRDPWDFEGSSYEAEKYRTTIASLPRERYGRALEVGCSIGVLTKLLAERCDSLLSVDVSERALDEARLRSRNLPQVQFARMQIPEEMPEGLFDLIVFSEVGYYLQREDLERTIRSLAAHQPTGGDVILVHFTPTVEDYPMTGDQVHEVWLAHPEWTLLRGERHERYRLDVLRRGN